MITTPLTTKTRSTRSTQCAHHKTILRIPCLKTGTLKFMSNPTRFLRRADQVLEIGRSIRLNSQGH